MAGLFGGMKSAFSKFNTADANGLTGMQRLGNVGSAMQGQGAMFAGQPQAQPGAQPGTPPPQPSFNDRLGAFGAQMQDIGGQGEQPIQHAPMAAPPQLVQSGLPQFGRQANSQAILQQILAMRGYR